MIETAEALPESIQRAVDLGISGIDIMHGELKIMMLVAEQEPLVELYRLTYDISFAIGARNEASR